jgi:rhamnosyltransferase
MAPDASVIILTKDAGKRFERVLSRVDSQEFDGEVETVVVDSGSTDGTVARAREHDCDIHHIDPDEFHHSRTRNFGAEQAGGDVLVHLTHDAIPQTDQWLERLVDPVRSGEASVVYGKQEAYPDAKPMDKFFYSYFYPDERQTLDAEDAEDPRQLYIDNIFISDVSAAIDRQAWEQFMFRDSVAMSEDKDFALRLLRGGHNVVYEPSAAVHHSHNYDLLSHFNRRYKDGAAYAKIAGEGTDTFVSDGVSYVVDELRFLLSNGYARWVPYAILYDFAHFSGFELGKYVTKQGITRLQP